MITAGTGRYYYSLITPTGSITHRKAQCIKHAQTSHKTQDVKREREREREREIKIQLKRNSKYTSHTQNLANARRIQNFERTCRSSLYNQMRYLFRVSVPPVNYGPHLRTNAHLKVRTRYDTHPAHPLPVATAFQLQHLGRGRPGPGQTGALAVVSKATTSAREGMRVTDY